MDLLDFQQTKNEEKSPQILKLWSILQHRPDQFYTCLNLKLTGSISFKPDIGNQEINLDFQEATLVIYKSQTSPFHAPAATTGSEVRTKMRKIPKTCTNDTSTGRGSFVYIGTVSVHALVNGYRRTSA